MSIRIQNDSLTGAAPSEASRADEISRPAGSSSQSAAKWDHSGRDSVEISSLSQQVAAASRAEQTHQANRVSQLTALYRSGRYSVDSAAVSHAMVSQALNADPPENS